MGEGCALPLFYPTKGHKMDFESYQRLIEQNKHKSEENVVARFYDRVVKTPTVLPNGLPEFRTVCYCEIRIKDNTTEVYDQPAGEDKYARFPAEYARYRLSKAQAENGAPLEQFAFLTAAEIESCKYRGIFTVEDLAAASDEHAADLGLSAEAAKARLFLENGRKAKQGIDAFALAEEYKKKIEVLEAELNRLKQTPKRRKKK